MLNTGFSWCSERLMGRTETPIQMPTAPPFRLCNVFLMVPKSFVFVLVLKPSINSKRSFYFSCGFLPWKAKFQQITQKCDRIRDVLKMVSGYKHDYTEEVKVKHVSFSQSSLQKIRKSRLRWLDYVLFTLRNTPVSCLHLCFQDNPIRCYPEVEWQQSIYVFSSEQENLRNDCMFLMTEKAYFLP